MTKSPQQPRNEITDEAVREAQRTGRHVCDILETMLRTAKKARDAPRRRKLEAAQKFLRCRNRRKRSR
jgi:hypothetical protein